MWKLNLREKEIKCILSTYSMPEPMIGTLQMVFHLIPSITWEVATGILILLMKWWLQDPDPDEVIMQDRWAVKWTKQDSIQSSDSWVTCSSCHIAHTPGSSTHSHLQAFPNHIIAMVSLQISIALLKVEEVELLDFPWWPLLLWKMSWWRQETEESNWEMTES